MPYCMGGEAFHHILNARSTDGAREHEFIFSLSGSAVRTLLEIVVALQLGRFAILMECLFQRGC